MWFPQLTNQDVKDTKLILKQVNVLLSLAEQYRNCADLSLPDRRKLGKRDLCTCATDPCIEYDNADNLSRPRNS